jgi:primosomal protein N' (replication factor Y) (superfamily II helicase)
MATPLASRFARVVVDVPLPQPLDYRLTSSDALAGQMCVVPVGRRSRMGLVVATASQTDIDPARLKDVGTVIEQVSPLARHWLDFTQFASDYYQHPWGEVALPALPPVLRTLPGPRFAQALARLRKRAIARPESAAALHRLTAQQQAAVEALLAARGFGVHLLFGITGSGKTEVYLRAIEDRLRHAADAQVLMLVPEINLTPQLESLLRARFGAVGVVVLHSGLPDGERSAAWLAAHEGRASSSAHGWRCSHRCRGSR